MEFFAKILKAINEGIKQSFIIDDELDIENDSIFQHEETNYNSLQGKMNDNYYHNFLACKLNDKIYYDPELSYNTRTGEYIGFCCIEAGVMPDNKPRFAYKEDLPEKMNWKDAKKKCKEIPNGYLPDKDELKTAYINGLSLHVNNLYWSSTQFASKHAYFLHNSNGRIINNGHKDGFHYVRPFIYIPQLEGLNENLQQSFIIDDDELKIENDSIFQHKETNFGSFQNALNSKYYYNFLACKLNDKIYYDPELGYNTKKGEYIGFCCIEAGVMPDNKPRFAYKEDLDQLYIWEDAKQKCKEIPNGYLSDKDELKLAFNNGLALSTDSYYWSSTQFDSRGAYFLDTGNGNIDGHHHKHGDYYVRPFFHIPQLEGLNENLQQSFIIDDDELEIENDSIFQHEKPTVKNGKQSFEDFLKLKKTEISYLALNMSSKEDYLKILDIWQSYGVQFTAFNTSLGPACRNAIQYGGNNCNLNWIDTSKVTIMERLFVSQSCFNGDVSSWNMSKVKNTESMFQDCKKFNCDISNWSLDSIENAKQMFYECSSLTTAPKLPATTLGKRCYYRMFFNCVNLLAAPALPATELSSECYTDMFHYCTKLTTAPELPATTLASFCYWRMFYGCSSLTAAPELPATTLANYCYQQMFSECKHLQFPPELPAMKLTEKCYNGMFYHCSHLKSLPELPFMLIQLNGKLIYIKT